MALDDVPSALDSQERWAGEITSVVKRLISDVANLQHELELVRIFAGVEAKAGEGSNDRIDSLAVSVNDLYTEVNEITNNCGAKHGELAHIAGEITSLSDELNGIARDLSEPKEAISAAYTVAIARLHTESEAFKETTATVKELDRLVNNWKGRFVMLMLLAGSIPAIIDTIWNLLKK